MYQIGNKLYKNVSVDRLNPTDESVTLIQEKREKK